MIVYLTAPEEAGESYDATSCGKKHDNKLQESTEGMIAVVAVVTTSSGVVPGHHRPAR